MTCPGFKRLVVILTLGAFAVSSGGCLTGLKRKFVRKRAKKEVRPYYHLEEYPDKPYSGRYHSHYTFWRNWHMELDRKNLTHKRQVSSANEALRHLRGMQACLIPEKALELEAQIEDMEEVCARIGKGRDDSAYNARLRRMLGKIERVVINSFGEKTMKAYLKPDGT